VPAHALATVVQPPPDNDLATQLYILLSSARANDGGGHTAAVLAARAAFGARRCGAVLGEQAEHIAGQATVDGCLLPPAVTTTLLQVWCHVNRPCSRLPCALPAVWWGASRSAALDPNATLPLLHKFERTRLAATRTVHSSIKNCPLLPTTMMDLRQPSQSSRIWTSCVNSSVASTGLGCQASHVRRFKDSLNRRTGTPLARGALRGA
jgi:hypothetical protein